MSIEQQANFQVNDLNHYQQIGRGQDLILLHGWGVSSAIWKTIAEQLSQHYRVHLVDLPGFGGAAEVSEYSLANIAKEILPSLPSNAIWCGWSLGGLVATYIAYYYPERVDKLIQVCTSLKFVEDAQWLGVKKDVFDTFKVGVNKHPKKTLNRFLSLQAMGSETVKSDILAIKDLLKEQGEATATALTSGLDLLNDVDLREQFKQLTIPSLSLFGEFDTLVPIANIEAIKKLSHFNQQVIFKHSAHAPFISETQAFKAALLDFIGE